MHTLSLGCFFITSWIQKKSDSFSVERSTCRAKYQPKKYNNIKTLNKT